MFALPGVVLIVWGAILARRRPASSSAIPPAKIDDGRPFSPPNYEWRRGIGAALIVIGILLALGGGFIGLLRESFGHGHWPPG